MIFKSTPFALLAFMAVVLPASGQTLALTSSGSGASGSGNNLSGTGTATIAGGAASATFTGLTSNGGQCDNSVQFSFKITAANGADSLTVFFYSASGSGNDGQSTITLPGALTVTADTGIYAGKGGSGTATLSVVLMKGATGDSSSFTYTLTGSVTLAGSLTTLATVNPGGVVPVNSDLPYVQPGSWVSIYGSNLASATTSLLANFPTSIGTETVSFDGKLGYLWFASAGQINVQVPDDTKTGCVPVVVNTPNGPVNTTVDLEPIAPSLNVLSGSNNGKLYAAAVILTPNGSGAYGGGAYDIMGPTGNFAFPTRPAHKGDILELFGVGFGPVKNPVSAGLPVTGSSATTNTVQVFTNVTQTSGIQFPVSFAGLVGQGLYQITVTVPQNATTGDSPLQVFVGTVTPGTNNNAGISNDLPVLMSIQ